MPTHEATPEPAASSACNPTTLVLLVDDHEVVRQGLRTLLADRDDLAVVAEAASAAKAVQRAATFEPDVVVVDVRLRDELGVHACRDIRARRPATAVVMLTSFADEQARFDSIMAGAAGFVLKQVRGTDLVDAVRRVAAGESLLGPHHDQSRRARRLDHLEQARGLSPHRSRRLPRRTPRPKGDLMSTDHATIDALTADQCHQLLLTHPLHLGRVAFADSDGVPVVLPVNFRLVGGDVVVRTGDGELLGAVRAGRSVAFEVDHVDPAWEDGWSVLVQGAATEVTDPDELDRLHQLPLRPWAPGDKSHWLRLPTAHVSGRRIL